ncbi:MAG: chalcone isomerase family protein [Deltaproteobacteria bacterium]|nr:chalcone isomerase family protein [Deltaproteobacteria bacterium]
MRQLGAIALLAFLLLAALPAAAAERAGVSFPDTEKVGSRVLVVNGLGVREVTFLGIDVYVAALYLPAKTTEPSRILDADAEKKIVMHFVRDVPREKIVEAFSQGFANNAGRDLPKLKTRIDKLIGWFTPATKSQRAAFSYEPGKGLSVVLAGSQKGVIEGADFARAFFAIWFGPHPPSEALKRGLLGLE